jgi:hypothetical protein
MYVSVDLSASPPRLELAEPDDFNSFAVVVEEHTYVGVDEVLSLAGPRAEDPEWREQFDAMLTFAGSKGWLREDNAIRAHVKIAPEAPPS